MDGEFTQDELEAKVDASTQTVRSVLGKMNEVDIAEPVDSDSEQWRVIE
jgi:Fic family protein